MDWLLIAELLYVVLLILVCLRIIYDTRTNTKTLAYLLLTVFIPVFGAAFYFSFGINYRKRKMYSKKIIEDESMQGNIDFQIYTQSKKNWEAADPLIQENRELMQLLLKDSTSPLTGGNNVKILVNGENKFPEVLEALEQAQHHIHIEYYIFENDGIGNKIKEILMRKAREGVQVRFIYDDFGSRTIRGRFVRELKAAGVQAFPFHRVLWIALANRLNYRNHRKIIIIDGRTGFVGGINVSDRYINNKQSKNIFWRDMHLRIDGDGINYLQYIFICDWNFCAGEKFIPNSSYLHSQKENKGNTLVQIAASGPDSNAPTILYSLLQAINLAKEEILITTPYFIPGESLLDALIVASLGGVTVKIIVPGISDSKLVNAAAHSYYDDLLAAGVEIYLYKKGFVHAKTMVTDGMVSVIGTANMDYRSFELNFEVNALVYDTAIAIQMREIFYADLKDCERINPARWEERKVYKKMLEKTARLVSPLL